MLKKIAAAEQQSCCACDARKFAWFEPGSDGQLVEREKKRSAQYQLDANQHLFMEGDELHHCYTLKTGWAICYKQLKDGERQIVHVALAGDFVGYKSDPNEVIDYSVMAVTDCVFCSFSENDMNALMTQDTDLIHLLIAIQTKQNQVCRRSLSYVGQSQAKNKVAHFLMDLIERLDQRGVDIHSTVNFPLSRIDIADAIGITPVHLGRVSVELKADDVLECRHNTLNVKNLDALKTLASSVL